jgi:release factor glutamine methyltransferase
MNQQGKTEDSIRDPHWTILKLLSWTTSYFKTHHIDQARTDAEILLAHLLGLQRIDLYVQHEKPLTQQELSRFRLMVKRRARREPVAYILGVKEFWSMDLEVGPEVLIPRPETECLVEAVLELLKERGAPQRILELGTGTGAISLALAREGKQHQFFASDRSVRAVFLAQKNAVQHKLDHLIAFFCGDWFFPLARGGTQFDFIVSNPPYIRSRDLDTLQPEICKYEPPEALDGGERGLDCIAHIIGTAPNYLQPGGWVMLEIGYDQGAEILKIIDVVDCYDEVIVKQDYSGYDRIVQMRKKHGELT